LVFTARQGGPLRESKFVPGYFKPAAVRAGLFVTRRVAPDTGRVVTSSSLRFHDLRHTCASLLIAQGASVKAVQAQLGHASATVTLDRYGHLFPDDLQQLADRLQDAYADAITDPARTEPPATCVGNAKRQVSDLPLVVEVGRLELPSRGVVPGLLRAQPPVEVQTRVVRWRRSRVLAS